MSFNISDALLLIAQPIGWRLSAQTFNQVLRTFWYFIGHLYNVNAT